jgi:hypothetical protein
MYVTGSYFPQGAAVYRGGQSLDCSPHLSLTVQVMWDVNWFSEQSQSRWLSRSGVMLLRTKGPSLIISEFAIEHREFWGVISQSLTFVSHTSSAFVWVIPISYSESESYITTEDQSASLSRNKAPIWGLRPDLYYVRELCFCCWLGAVSLTTGRVCRL